MKYTVAQLDKQDASQILYSTSTYLTKSFLASKNMLISNFVFYSGESIDFHKGKGRNFSGEDKREILFPIPFPSGARIKNRIG